MYFYEKYTISNGFTNKPTLYIDGKYIMPYDEKKGHTGIDVIMPMGTPLSLPFETTCVQVQSQIEMGLTVYLEDKYGNVSVFSHNSDILVNEGERVAKSQVFALSGDSGTISTNPHSHAEVIAKEPQPGYEHMTRKLGGISGYNIEPLTYFERMKNEKRPVHWSKPSMRKLQHLGIITEEKTPTDTPTWGELAVVLDRIINLE